MKMDIFNVQIFVTCIALLSCHELLAQPRIAPTTQLIKKMRLDEVTTLGIPRQYLPNEDLTLAKYTPFLKCIEHADQSQLRDTLAYAIDEALSHADVMEASSFYNSAAGKKYSAFLVQQARLAYGLPNLNNQLPLEKSAERAAERFNGTDAGKKLSYTNLAGAPQFVVRLFRANEAILHRCRHHLQFRHR